MLLIFGFMMQDEDDGQEWPPSCSRRDANLFLRGVKRFGTIDRLPDIAAEIGVSFESIPNTARWGPHPLLYFAKLCFQRSLSPVVEVGLAILTGCSASIEASVQVVECLVFSLLLD